MKTTGPSYSETLERLDEYVNFEKKPGKSISKYKLHGEIELLSRLGDPHKKFPCVHVAGTVGKGSVCIMLDAALMAQGYRTGLFTSPHIVDFRERIRVNGKMISKKDFSSVFSHVANQGQTDPRENTFFEIVTAMSFHYFAERNVDIAIVETGLGGRLDCTNVVPPFIAAITRIGLDHTDLLGDTIEKIASEKAGIIKRGGDVVALKQKPAANRVIEETCARGNAKLFFADESVFKKFPELNFGERFRNPGIFRENLSVVLALLKRLQERGFVVGNETIESAISCAEIPCRIDVREIVTQKGRLKLVLDAGHNPAAAAALGRELDGIVTDNNLILIAGMMKDKDAGAFFRALAGKAKTVICTSAGTKRAFGADELADIAKKNFSNVTTAKNVSEALDQAVNRSSNGDIICLAGTFYLLKQALSWVKRKN